MVAEICYVLAIPEGSAPGVDKKVENQVAEWTRAGHCVELVRPASDAGRLGRIPMIWKARHSLKDSGTTAYVRWLPWCPGLIGLLRSCRSAIEVNAAFWDELADSALFRVLDRLFGARMFAAADVVVAPTFEVAEGLRTRYSVDEDKIVVLANPVPAYSASGNAEPERRVVYLCGSLNAPWHGVDRYLAIARLCPDVHFLLVGGSTLNDLADGGFGEIPLNLDFRGPLFGQELSSVLESCQIGIGTLALERKNMREACALKVREYVAHGLPVYLPHLDTDFGDDRWFVRTVEADSPVDHATWIVEFLEQVGVRRVQPSELSGLYFADKERRRLAAIFATTPA